MEAKRFIAAVSWFFLLSHWTLAGLATSGADYHKVHCVVLLAETAWLLRDQRSKPEQPRKTDAHTDV